MWSRKLATKRRMVVRLLVAGRLKNRVADENHIYDHDDRKKYKILDQVSSNIEMRRNFFDFVCVCV